MTQRVQECGAAASQCLGTQEGWWLAVEKALCTASCSGWACGLGSSGSGDENVWGTASSRESRRAGPVLAGVRQVLAGVCPRGSSVGSCCVSEA